MSQSIPSKTSKKTILYKKVNTYILFAFIVAIPLSYYFLVHVPEQEKVITARNLRLVKDFSEQIAGKFDELGKLIHTAATDAVKHISNEKYHKEEIP